MNPNEQPLSSQTPRPLSSWTNDELDDFYKKLCPGAAPDLSLIDTKPKAKRKKKDNDDEQS